MVDSSTDYYKIDHKPTDLEGDDYRSVEKEVDISEGSCLGNHVVVGYVGVGHFQKMKVDIYRDPTLRLSVRKQKMRV